MKILISKKFEQEINISTNINLKNKTLSYLNNFEKYFKDLSDFDTNKIRKFNMRDTNIFLFRVEPKYSIVFTAEYDRDRILNVALLDMVTQDELEKTLRTI